MATIPVGDARKVAVASAVGTTIEWYDFFIYGTAAATVFGPRFFPQFPPSIRYSGASLSNTLGTILGGAPAPFVAAALYDRFDASAAVGVYMTALAFVSWISVWGMKETGVRTTRPLARGEVD